MRSSSRSRRGWRLVLWLSLASATISAVYGYANSGEPYSALVGIASSLAIATPIILLEVKGQRTILRRLHRLPLLAYFGLKVAYYTAAILGGLLLVRVLDIIDQKTFEESFQSSVVFSIGMSLFANVVLEAGRLLGFATLKNLLLGRYVQPRREQRAFLLIDMRDSTGIAEQLGAVRFHELLNDFFRDVSDAAYECDGDIHKYVGDEAILTWRDGPALGGGACLLCPFLARDLIERRRGEYMAHHGTVPAFRAALHYGEIVTGEIGDVRREIAHVGDTLNTAARLLEAAKELGRDVLVSDELLGRAALPEGMRVEKLPTLSVRGRARALAVSALTRAA